MAVASDLKKVGGDFGRSWLNQNGTAFVTETKNSLWNWGSMPKGYTIVNGTAYPPGYGIQWYYPSFMTSSTPLIINRTAISRNTYNPPEYISPEFMYESPWILAQLTGRPVATISAPPSGYLF